MEFKRFALAMVGHFLASLLYVMRRLRLIDAVVDTSSYLEHREELKELWEKRMMADDNQSPPSSATVAEDKTSPNTTPEEGSEEKVAKKSSQSETIEEHKMSNGFIKSIDTKDGDVTSNGITNGHHEQEVEKVNAPEESPVVSVIDNSSTDVDNNSPDSLEAEEYVEKTYTSETSLVITKQNEVISCKSEDSVTKEEEEQVQEESKKEEAVSEESVLNSSEQKIEQSSDTSPETTTELPTESENKCEVKSDELECVPDVKLDESVGTLEKDITEKVEDNQSSPDPPEQSEEVPMSASEDKLASPPETALMDTSAKLEVSDNEAAAAATEEVVPEMTDAVDSNSNEVLFKSLEVQQTPEEDDDGFVRVEECLPKVENSDADQESFVMVEEAKMTESAFEETMDKPETAEGKLPPLTNGHSASPTSLDLENKQHPEIEQFVKSGGLKRVLPGVQKTEQPYSTCTTETKIAMEIREMREREEELRQMREQALLSPVPPKSPVTRTPSPSMAPSLKEAVPPPTPSPTPSGYRVSSVFGPARGTLSPQPSTEEDRSNKAYKCKESAVEKEIRLARDREEELRKQKGLPPREDDSYVKPSQVKSSQVRVFGKVAGHQAVRQAATAKIQLEIEEQTQREMALRDTGSIQTISQERTDNKVAKLKTESQVTNGNGCNDGYTNGRSSPDVVPPYKRSSPSPTGSRPASIFSQPSGKSGISMHKFITSKGKEATFSAPKTSNGGAFVIPREEKAPVVPPNQVKLKRNVSVESKIQQEIMEMKQREEELKLLHLNKNNNEHFIMDDDNEDTNQKNNMGFDNGNGVHEEDLSPRHNKLIAQWEQRIQKAES